MRFSGLGARVRQRARRALFLARLHPRRAARSAWAGRHCFITCTGKHDGPGAQALAQLSTMVFAESVGLPYVHTPFQRMGDAPLEVVASWERFFNLGLDELPLSATEPLHLDRVALTSLLDLPSGGRDTLYVVRHCHEYANAFPGQYERGADRFARKYRSSPKGDLPSHYDPSRLNVAVHVRRGDVTPHGPHASRYTSNGRVAAVVREVVSASAECGRPPAVHLYSEGDVAAFGELRDMEIAFHLDESAFATFHDLVSADVLVMAKSTFSYVAALLSRGVKVYESFRGTPLDHRPLGQWLAAGRNGRLDRKLLRRAVAGLERRS